MIAFLAFLYTIVQHAHAAISADPSLNAMTAFPGTLRAGLDTLRDACLWVGTILFAILAVTYVVGFAEAAYRRHVARTTRLLQEALSKARNGVEDLRLFKHNESTSTIFARDMEEHARTFLGLCEAMSQLQESCCTGLIGYMFLFSGTAIIDMVMHGEVSRGIFVVTACAGAAATCVGATFFLTESYKSGIRFSREIGYMLAARKAVRTTT